MLYSVINSLEAKSILKYIYRNTIVYNTIYGLLLSP